MLINTVFKKVDLLSPQAALFCTTIPEHYFKYVKIPLSNNLRAICRLHPQPDVTSSVCLISPCVIQYSTLADLHNVISSHLEKNRFELSSMEILDSVANAETVEVSLILYKNTDVLRVKNDASIAIYIRFLLRYYVFVNSSIIILPDDGSLSNIVSHICVTTKGHHKQAFRVSTSTSLNITSIVSLQKFKILTRQNYTRIIGMEKQMVFLLNMYNANLMWKKSCGLSSNCLQKFLIVGPTGSGKSSLIQYFVETQRCGLVIIDGYKLMNSSKDFLMNKFNQAAEYCQTGEEEMCILHFEQIDRFYHLWKSTSALMRKHSRQISVLLDDIHQFPGIMVIASTNDTQLLDSANIRSKFQSELHINLPSRFQREEILELYNPNLAKHRLAKLADCTPSYSGADLRFLSREVNKTIRLSGSQLQSELEFMDVWKKCIRKHKPISMKTGIGVVQFGGTQLKHLGGLSDVKNILRTYVEWPLLYPGSFKRLGILNPKGILLYGPPGCAKTSLACAIANDTNTNFLAVSAAEIYSPYVGEAEKNVVDLFEKARINSPCILFIDEIDTLVGNRNASSKSVQSKVLSTFLTELDGIGTKFSNSIHVTGESNVVKSNDKNIVIIAATNRPNKIDAALLRPGRFDKMVFVGPPSIDDRFEIMKTIIENDKIPISNAVDLMEIAEKTDHFSGADLKCLIREAGYNALLESELAAAAINQQNFLQALQIVKSSLKD